MYRRIRDLREDSDLFQKDLAEYLQCSQVCYSHYEMGKRDIPTDILIKLADFYADAAEAEKIIEHGEVPVMKDPGGEYIRIMEPEIVVDGIIAKRNTGTTIDMAPLTIALGPGFTAGADADYVIETMRGHDLGRIISEGRALPDTGVPLWALPLTLPIKLYSLSSAFCSQYTVV